MPRLTALLALALAAGCPKPGPGTADAPRLRVDAVVVHDPGTLAHDLEGKGFYLFVRDVSADGDRIVASVGFAALGQCGNTGPLLIESADRGATWTSHALPAPDSAYWPAWQCAPPVQASGGGTAMLLQGVFSNGLAWSCPVRVDLAADKASAPSTTTRVLGAWPVVAPYLDRFESYGCSQQNEGLWSWSLQTDQARNVLLRGSSCGPTLLSLRTGRGFESYGIRATAAGGSETCHYVNDPDAAVHQAYCAPGAELPEWALTDANRVIAASRGVLWPSVRGAAGARHVLLLDIGAPGEALVFDLGVGQLTDADVSRQENFRPRFGSLVPLSQESGRRFFDVKADGTVDELVLPATPCERDDVCLPTPAPTGALVWAQPLGGDEYLDFYVVDVNGTEGSVHHVLYAVRDRATRVPTGIAGVKAIHPFPQYPNAVQASYLEALCYRFAGCFPAWDAKTCLEHFSWIRNGATALDTEYQRFLATPPGSCAAFDTAWTRSAPPDEDGGPCTQTVCADGIRHLCSGGRYVGRQECARLEATCGSDGCGYSYPIDCWYVTSQQCDGAAALRCVQGRGRWVDCGAFGMTCAAGAAFGCSP